jgi:hypothetical protein
MGCKLNACIKESVLNSRKYVKNNAEILNGRLTVTDCHGHQQENFYVRHIITFTLLCAEQCSNVLCIQGFVLTDYMCRYVYVLSLYQVSHAHVQWYISPQKRMTVTNAVFMKSAAVIPHC